MKDKMEEWVEKARTAIKWVAVDAYGCVWGYLKKPFVNNDGYDSDKETVYLGNIDDKELIKNWKKSLRKVEYGK